MLTIAEIKSNNWELKPTFDLPIDRTGVTVREYLEGQDIRWIFGNHNSDIKIYKEISNKIKLKSIVKDFFERIKRFKDPYISLIGEPRELAQTAYFFADPKNTLAVAPGDNLKRLYFASLWNDPMLDNWNKRLDKFCWIARPTSERIEIAKQIISMGIELDIFSKKSWGIPQWKGYAENEIMTAMKYKYKIVCENSDTYKYHSEKLFNSIKSGCVTFYKSDSSLHFPNLQNSFIFFSIYALKDYKEFVFDVLKGIEKVMFTNNWEIYSFKAFYDRIIKLSLEIIS